MKKTVIMLLILAMTLSLCACGKTASAPAAPAAETEAPAAETEAPVAETEAPTEFVFTDDAGREVTLPTVLTRVAPSGTVAAMFLAVVCPENMVCIDNTPYEDQRSYLPDCLYTLPATGKLYGSKSTLNLEALLSADPQLIIDMGEAKSGIAEDLDALQEQIGIPVIFIESGLSVMADAFRKLGSLIDGTAQRCEALADYVDETLLLAETASSAIPAAERVSVLYTSGTEGLNANAKGSMQAQVLDLVGADNAVVVEDVSSKGGGTLLSMEQIYRFDPDVILFTPESMFETAAGDPAWQQLRAVQDGKYYEIPAQPYNWLGVPPSLNMLLGVRWLGTLLYPRQFDLDIVAETQRAYALLWNCALSEAEVTAMLSRSTGLIGG